MRGRRRRVLHSCRQSQPAARAALSSSENGLPTILFDEIDAVFGAKAKENEDIRAVLNAGYRRGAKVGRCIMVGNGVNTEELPAFCAVALAGLGWLPDTILTRTIIVRMRRRLPYEKKSSHFGGGSSSQQVMPFVTSLPLGHSMPSKR
jgi:hypothetical protein